MIQEMPTGTISAAELSGRAEYARLLRAVRRGDMVRLRQGVYAPPESLLGTMIDVEKIVPNGVVCLYSAWMHHQLCSAVPPAFCVAIDSKRKIKLAPDLPIALYYWKAEYLTFGIEQSEVSGFQVRMTDVERSVCDAVKYRNKIGVDLCAEIMRNYLRRKDRNLSRLMDYARRLRLVRVISNYLEIALQ